MMPCLKHIHLGERTKVYSGVKVSQLTAPFLPHEGLEAMLSTIQIDTPALHRGPDHLE